jgi:hypothetical protein
MNPHKPVVKYSELEWCVVGTYAFVKPINHPS